METKSWTPAQLLELSGGYWSACALHAGVKLDLFTPLVDLALDANEMAGRTGCDPRGIAMLLDATSALGLLVKSGERYALSPFSAEYLVRDSPKYLGHIILHHHHLMDGWNRLGESVRSGAPNRGDASHSDDEGSRESFLMGMYNLAMQIAPLIVPQVDLKGRRRLLDLGGGPGTYAIKFCRHNPSLSAVICDLPTTRAFAERVVGQFGLSDRITFQPLDFLHEEIPGGFDVAWLSHILHMLGPDEAASLVKKTAAALEPGAKIMIQEFILDDNRDAPLFPALFSLNMLIGTSRGQAYTQGELMGMLTDAGVVDLRRIPLQLPNGSGVITGKLPR